MISIIVPVKNEEKNLNSLILEILNVTNEGIPIREIIYIDDGSTDGTLKALINIREKTPFLKIIKHEKSCGQSMGLWTGINAAENPIIVTLDGDGQNNPADIAAVYQVYKDKIAANPDGRLMVAGQRVGRQDTWVRKITSRIANKIRASILNDGTRDTGCSLKLFTKKDYLSLPYFNHMHRYIPALMKREGVEVLHADVSHRARVEGTSKYGTIDRLLAGILDLAGVWWILKRARPFIKITKV